MQPPRFHSFRGRTTLFVAWAAALVTVLPLTGCDTSPSRPVNGQALTHDPAPAIWRFAIEESEGSVQHKYAQKFKSLIEERTDGEVSVVVYPYGTLGTSTHMTEQLNMGVIEFAMASPGSLGKFIPELQVFLLHFLLPADDAANRRLLNDPKVIEFFDQSYAARGLQLLSFYSEGEMVWTMKKETRSPKDFRGVKMRVMTSPILLSAYNAYDASATPMPYSEVYSGLQLNMIDGQVNPVFAIERQKFYEVTSWLVFPRHASFITSCAAHRPFIESLSAERRQLLKAVMMELDAYIFDVQTSLQTERLKVIIREKKRRRSPLNLCGELQPFLDGLTESERQELVVNNDYLTIHPPLSAKERAAFREASHRVNRVFLDIGGPRARETLDFITHSVETLAH